MFAHLLADFTFQTKFVADWKGKSDLILAVHCFVWAATVYFALYVTVLVEMSSLWAFAFLFLGHFIIDRWKARKDTILRKHLYIDQALHLVQIIVLMLIWG